MCRYCKLDMNQVGGEHARRDVDYGRGPGAIYSQNNHS